jgi:hypothetical protein
VKLLAPGSGALLSEGALGGGPDGAICAGAWDDSNVQNTAVRITCFIRGSITRPPPLANQRQQIGDVPVPTGRSFAPKGPPFPCARRLTGFTQKIRNIQTGNVFAV